MEEHSVLAPDKTWIANKRLDYFGMCSVVMKTWVDRRDLHPLRDLHRVECCDYTTDNMRNLAMRGRIELPSSDGQSGIMAII